MTAARKKSTSKGIGRLTDEFTSGQLVIGMVVCLLIFLCCFLVGILVGKLDPSVRADGPPEKTTTQARATSPEKSKPEEKATRPDAPSAPARNTTPYTRPDERAEGPRSVRLAPLSSRDDAPSLPPARIPKPEAPRPEPKPKPVETPPPTAKPPLVEAKEAPPKEVAPEKPAPTPVPQAPPEATTPSPSAPAAVDGPLRGYGIQLAAFSGDKRQAEGEAYRRRLQENAGLEARLLNEGVWCKVVVVGYNDEAAAKAACAELRKTPAFEGAWVRKLP